MPLPQSAGFGRIKARPPYAAPGQAIGLLGGSFNPPHVAHRMISEVALKRLGLDKVWWIVSPGNPLKRRAETAPLQERMILCRAVAKNPHIIVTDFEADLTTPYTASTLAFLKSRNPLVRYVWIMGADNLATFDRWQRWREIFTTVPVVVVDRPGWRMKALASKAARAFAAPGCRKRRPRGWRIGRRRLGPSSPGRCRTSPPRRSGARTSAVVSSRRGRGRLQNPLICPGERRRDGAANGAGASASATADGSAQGS